MDVFVVHRDVDYELGNVIGVRSNLEDAEKDAMDFAKSCSHAKQLFRHVEREEEFDSMSIVRYWAVAGETITIEKWIV